MLKNIFVLALFCFILISSAFAYSFPVPSVNGASGLVRIPDATVIPYKNWNIGIDYGSTINGNNSVPAMLYKANLGTFHNFELGFVGGYDNTGLVVREGVFINMKYSPAIGDGSDPLLLAIGVENLASHTQAGVYMVATKPLKQGPKLTFGFMADFPAGKFRPLGMAGLDLPIGSSLSILTDMFAGETIFQVNAGVRYFIIPSFAIDGRAINVLKGAQTKDSQQYLVGFSWANPF